MSAEMITAIGAFVMGVAAIISAILLNRKTMALLEYRMDQVEKKLDTHNGYAKLFSECSERITKTQTDVAVIKANIEFLKKENG